MGYHTWQRTVMHKSFGGEERRKETTRKRIILKEIL
jgi:hypothetical protein